MESFEKMLYEISEESAHQSPDIINRIKPWRKMFNYLIWGMFVLLFVIRFGGIVGYILSYFNPLLGSILLMKGFAIAKSQNKYFKRAYFICCGYYIYRSVMMILQAFPVYQRLSYRILIVTLVEPVFLIVIMYHLKLALEKVTDSAEITTQIRTLFLKIIWLIAELYLVLIIRYYLQSYVIVLYMGTILIVVLYISLVKKLAKIRNILNEQEYSIRFPDKKRHYLNQIFIILDLVITIILTVWLVQYYSQISGTINIIDTAGETAEGNYSREEVSKVREQLISMGMKPSIAEDLLPVDIMKFKDVKRLLKSTREKDFEYAGVKLRVTCYLGELYYNETTNEDSGSVDGIYVDELLYYFEWVDNPDRPNAELLKEILDEETYYIDCSTEASRWIHIADVNNQKIYYDSNKKIYTAGTGLFYSQNMIIHSGTNLVKNADNYRSYSVHRLYSIGEFNTLEINFEYLKEQRIYPYKSLLDATMQNTCPELLWSQIYTSSDFSLEQYLSGEINYLVNNEMFIFTINRNITDIEEYSGKKYDDIYDDYDVTRNRNHALYADYREE